MLGLHQVSGPAGVASVQLLLSKSTIGMLYEWPLEAQHWEGAVGDGAF